MKAVKCPVCSGTGKIEPYKNYSTTNTMNLITCHGCQGKGWVEVAESYSDYYFKPLTNPIKE